MGRYSLSSFARAILSSAYGSRKVTYEPKASREVGKKNLLNGVQDIRFAIFVSVGTDAQVDLAWVFVGFESLGDT